MSKANRIFAVLGRVFLVSVAFNLFSVYVSSRQLALFGEFSKQEMVGVAPSEELKRQMRLANFLERFGAFVVFLPAAVIAAALGVRSVRKDLQ